MKNTKRAIYAMIFLLVVATGAVFANREIKNETAKVSMPKPPSTAEREAAVKAWEATPDGILFKKWEASPAGQKVSTGEAKIRQSLRDYSDMEGVITSLSLPPGSRLGFGVMVSIDGVEYIVRFDPEKSQLHQLRSLKVNDKIILKSHNVSHAPKYQYPIVTCEYLERDGKVIFQRVPRKDGC